MKVNEPLSRESRIKFGTDGWRAIIGEDFTFENIRVVTQAFAEYLKEYRRDASDSEKLSNEIVVGYDCRFLADRFAKEASRVLENNGFKTIRFEKPVPTPLVSWTVKNLSTLGGVVITASHNSAEFCGFKLKAPWGGSASSEITSKVESFLYKNVPLDTVSTDALVIDSQNNNYEDVISGSVSDYRKQIESLVDLDLISNSKQSVIIDSMHGSGGSWIESFFRDRELRYETIRKTPDPYFGGVNPEPIDQNLGPLRARVLETNSLIGIATDGDADRIGAVDELGKTMTMHQVVPILLLYLARSRKLKGAVVSTFSQSILVKRISKKFNLRFFETAVGFKYIADLMLAEDVLIGAEESGGIGVAGHIPERDAILNALLLLEAVMSSGKTPTELVSEIHDEFGTFFYERRDIEMEPHVGQEFILNIKEKGLSEIAGEAIADIQTIDGVKCILKDGSWLLFRQSGTEPVMRIYSEATSRSKLSRLLDEGCAINQYAI